MKFVWNIIDIPFKTAILTIRSLLGSSCGIIAGRNLSDLAVRYDSSMLTPYLGFI